MSFTGPVARVVVCVAALSASSSGFAQSTSFAYGYLSNPYVPVPVSLVDGNVLPLRASTPLDATTPRVVVGPAPADSPSMEWPLAQPTMSPQVASALTWPASEASFGFAPGYSGLAIVDVGGDGQLDVVASTAGTYWYIASWTPQGLKKSFVSQSYAGGIVDLGVATLGAVDHVFVATPTVLHVHRLDDKALVVSLPMPQNLRHARLADLDQDGDVEVITLSSTEVMVRDLATQALGWSVPAPSSWTSDLAIGDFRDEPGLEVVVAGEANRVLSGTSGEMLWSPPGNLADVAAGNFDADPQLEFAGVENWDTLRVYDARQSAQTWTLTAMGDLASIGAHDFDDDAQDELLVSNGQWGHVCAYSTISHLQIHCISNQEHGVGRMAAGNLDGVGPDEIVWGSGVTSSGEDQLAYGNFTSTQQLWWANDESAAHPDTHRVDVDTDGELDYVYATYSSRSGYGSGRLHVADPATMLDRWVSPELAVGRDWLGTGGLDVGQLDDDSAREIVVATANIRSPILEIYDGASHVLQRSVPLPLDVPYGTPARLPRIIDQESVLIEYDGALRRIRTIDGVATWTSPILLGGRVNTLSVVQADRDPALEAIAATNGAVTMFDLETGASEWNLLLGGAATVHEDTRQLVLAAGAQVRIYDIPSRRLIRSFPVTGTSKGAWIGDVGNQRVVFASLDNGGLQAFLANSGELVLSQQTDRPTFAHYASHVPFHSQGGTATFWAPSNYAVHRAEVRFVDAALFADGFE